MPQFSIHAGFGSLRFSNEASRSEVIYDAMISGRSGAFDMSEGTYLESKVFAQSHGIASARGCLERAQNQLNPYTCTDLLPQLEADWGVIPTPNATLYERQRAVAVKMALSRGAKREALESGLRDILGAAFIALRTLSLTESVDHAPTTANFARVDLPWKLVRITEPVTATGAPLSRAYANVDLTAAPLLLVPGDVLTVQPDHTALSEVVTVTAVTPGEFVATYANPHDANCVATTQNWANWTSATRTLLVVATAAASANRTLCQRVDDFLEGAARSVGDWAIVTPSTPGATTIGPFTLDSSALGSVTVGLLDIYP